MIGIVSLVDSQKKFALLDVAGVSGSVAAPFSEIKNAAPRVLDFSEVVSCTLHRRNGGDLYAKEIQILTGAREREALLKMRPFAPWAKNIGEKYTKR